MVKKKNLLNLLSDWKQDVFLLLFFFFFFQYFEMFRISLNIQNGGIYDNDLRFFNILEFLTFLSYFDKIWTKLHDLSRSFILDIFFTSLALTGTLVLLSVDLPCLCKQCRSRLVGFWRSLLIWFCILSFSMWICINNLDQATRLANN